GAGQVLAVGLRGRDDVARLLLAVESGASSQDGAAVDHDGRAIEAAHRHYAARHVLVAAGQRHEGIVPLRAHDGLDGVGDEVARLQRVAHPLGAHADAVGHPDRVEPHADHSSLHDAFLHVLGEAVEVHVAGVALPPVRHDADLRLVEIFLAQTRGVEHGLGDALREGLGDAAAVSIQLGGGLHWEVTGAGYWLDREWAVWAY